MQDEVHSRLQTDPPHKGHGSLDLDDLAVKSSTREAGLVGVEGSGPGREKVSV